MKEKKIGNFKKREMIEIWYFYKLYYGKEFDIVGFKIYSL